MTVCVVGSMLCSPSLHHTASLSCTGKRNAVCLRYCCLVIASRLRLFPTSQPPQGTSTNTTTTHSLCLLLHSLNCKELVSTTSKINYRAGLVSQTRLLSDFRPFALQTAKTQEAYTDWVNGYKYRTAMYARAYARILQSAQQMSRFFGNRTRSCQRGQA